MSNNTNEITDVNKKLKETENSLQALNRLRTILTNQFHGAWKSITGMLSLSSFVTLLIKKAKEAVSELKEINTLLTKIQITNDKLSKSDLERISNLSFTVANKYGIKTTDYLSGVQELYRAGYQNAEELAELSAAAQSTGTMTAELANQMILAADKAYQMNGSVSELTKILDGMNHITNHNAITMSELSEGLSDVGSIAASLGIDADKVTAALSTMIAATQKSGSETAHAFKTILMYIGQITDKEAEIDAEGLAQYEQACNALNVSLKETRNGIQSLRDPMKVLKDLSTAYNNLDESDNRRTDLLDSVGGGLTAAQLDALLIQWDTYESMLQQYTDGTGSMSAEAEKTANSWEGSLNRLSNTWTDTIGNITDSDAIIATVNSLNGILSAVNAITGALGSWGSIGVGAGITAFVKNFA